MTEKEFDSYFTFKSSVNFPWIFVSLSLLNKKLNNNYIETLFSMVDIFYLIINKFVYYLAIIFFFNLNYLVGKNNNWIFFLKYEIVN
jgi:hypothetical protein